MKLMPFSSCAMVSRSRQANDRDFLTINIIRLDDISDRTGPR